MALQLCNLVDWLGRHLLSCPVKATFGIDCPGCGLQRSVLALLRGDLLTSFKLYPATIPLIFIVVFTLLHLKLEFEHGARLIKIVYAGVAVIILINYIYKIYTHQLIS